MTEDRLYRIDVDGYRGARLTDMQCAMEGAQEWMAETGADRVECIEYRPPTALDLPDYTSDVIAYISERLAEDETLGTDDGDCPTLDPDPQPGVLLESLRLALGRYVREHTDLSCTGWIETGDRVSIVRSEVAS